MSAHGTTEIPALTGLRGIAACWVVLFHIGNQAGQAHPDWRIALDWLAGGGFLGVDLFFVLSGFVIALNYAGDAAPHSPAAYGRFLQKRLARIYPVHLAALGLLLAGIGLLTLASVPVARPHSRDVEGLLKSVLLLQGWTFPIRSTWNIPSWSVSVEWLAYLLFPLLSLFLSRFRSTLIRSLAILTLLTVLPYVVSSHLLPGTMAFGLPRIAVEFTLGVILYGLWRDHPQWRTLSGRTQWLVLGAALATCNLLAITIGEQQTLKVAPAIAGIVVWALASGAPGSSCLDSGPAGHLGRISYSLYMLHGIWILFAQTLLRHSGLRPDPTAWVLTMVLVVLLSLLSAHWMYTHVEEPARRYLASRRFTWRRNATARWA